MSTPIAQHTIVLSVQKATGTHGDTLIAWGLAIFVSELLGDEEAVILSDCSACFRVEVQVAPDELERAINRFTSPMARSRLKWLESKQNNRTAPTQFGDSFTLDRDNARDAHRLWRESRRAMQPQAGGSEPQFTAPADTQLYPFYEVLTNPGTQWAGYNSFVERLYSTLTPEGVRSLLVQFGAFGSAQPTVDQPVKRGAKPPMFNPPGFLYPGMNKGPTMRITGSHGVTIGSASAADWTLADRGDRTLFENYLAYIGYFQVARIVTTKEQRVIVVPIPDRVEVPFILNAISSVARRDGLSRELEGSDLTNYLAAQNTLEYGRAALTYLADLRGREGRYELKASGIAFKGVHFSVYWRPNGNVFAPRRITQVALPAWLPSLLVREGRLVAQTTLDDHQKRLKHVRGPRRNENKLSSEQREALERYLLSTSGDLPAWLEMVAAWFPAARAAARANWAIRLWSTEEIRRIALAMSTGNNQASLAQLLDAPEFDRLAAIIRNATVVPHIAREMRKRNPALESSPWEIRYGLPTELRQAAERGANDFLQKFYTFIASYNDETARPKTGRGRPFARTDDLQWLSEQMAKPEWKKTLPAALLAFGTSLRGKPTKPPADATHDSGGADVSPEVIDLAGAEDDDAD